MFIFFSLSFASSLHRGLSFLVLPLHVSWKFMLIWFYDYFFPPSSLIPSRHHHHLHFNWQSIVVWNPTEYRRDQDVLEIWAKTCFSQAPQYRCPMSCTRTIRVSPWLRTERHPLCSSIQVSVDRLFVSSTVLSIAKEECQRNSVAETWSRAKNISKNGVVK